MPMELPPDNFVDMLRPSRRRRHERAAGSCELKSSTAILTINRADKRNALSRGLIDALADAFRRALNEERARCIILAAAGPVFCAGMDLAELQESLDIAHDETPVWDDASRPSL